MAKIEEIPVTCKQAREILGWCRSYMSAVRRAMGLKRRYVFVSELKAFIRKNPNFTSSQIYHPSKCKCEACQTKRLKAMIPLTSVPTSQTPDSPPQESNQVVTVNCRTPEGFYRKLLGQMFSSHRRKAGLTGECVTGKDSVSRETLRKLEKGLPVKLSTVYQIAAAECMNDRELREATALWLKDQAGGYADQIRIELNDSIQAETNSDLNLLTERFTGLERDKQQTLLTLTGYLVAASIVEQAQPKAAVASESEYETLIAECPQDDLWASL